MKSLVIAEVFKGRVRKASLSAISAGEEIAKKTGGSFSILIIGKNVEALSEELCSYGAEKVYLVQGDIFEHYLAEPYAQAVEKVVREKSFDAVLATANTFGKDLMPRVAAKLNAGMASDITGILEMGNEAIFTKPFYAGSVNATIKLKSRPFVFTVRGTAFPKAQPVNGVKSQKEIVPLQIDESSVKARFLKFDEIVSKRPELTEAEIVVSGGRGVKSKENFKLIEDLADVLGAAVGASRAAVDSGFCPNDWQVGQTGKIVAPNLYFAIGISGAIQHVAGMKDSKVIVAINKDEEAPIFQIADYGLVADLFKVVPELIEKLKKIKEEEK